MALIISLLVFLVSLGLIAPYWFAHPMGYTFSTDVPWIHYPPIRYHVMLDGLSLWLVLLTTLLTPVSVLVSWKHIDHRVKEFFAFLILLEFGLIGVFIAADLFLFYVFWEVSLVPMYFLIGIWGHERRIYAAVKFFIYTMAGSVLMLTAIIYLYNRSGSLDYLEILSQLQTGRLVLDPQAQMLLFLAFFISFAIKVPLFPLHTWLPDAHVEAPTAGSIMLASVMLKMGTYGLIRFCLPLFPQAAQELRPVGNSARHRRYRIRSAGSDGAAEYEEAGRLFFGQPSRFRGPRHLLFHATRTGWRGVPDAEPWHLDGRALHAGRLSL